MGNDDGVSYPAVLADAEAALIDVRRGAGSESVGASDHHADSEASALSSFRRALPDDTVGFGLSGGGIRSATFCLGVFQALARERLLRRVDYISTVSGGGYFGGFLGRLFTRSWVKDIHHVEEILSHEAVLERQRPTEFSEWSARVFRWLRENGRYLAPRGSGDVWLLGATLLRNWVAVQVVLVTTVLTLFLALQLIRVWVERMSGRFEVGIEQWLACQLPTGMTLLWWSPWVLIALIPLLLLTIPAGWAYWIVTARTERLGIPPLIALIFVITATLIGVRWYSSPLHLVRLAVCAVSLLLGVLTLFVFVLVRPRDDPNGGVTQHQISKRMQGALRRVPTSSDPNEIAKSRNRLSHLLQAGLIATVAVIAWALVDTSAATLYAKHGLWNYRIAELLSGFAGIGAFARQVMVLFAPADSTKHTALPISIVTWIAAAALLATWLIAIDVGAQAVRWNFHYPEHVPSQLGRASNPKVMGADHLLVQASSSGYIVRAINADAQGCDPLTTEPKGVLPATPDPVVYVLFGALLSLTFIFGNTQTFANLSTIHTFYAARLTRTFLGASNPQRLIRDTRVKESLSDDDCRGGEYWQWPHAAEAERTTGNDPNDRYRKGAPLHIVNTTVNETFDARTRVQNQDRKGTGLAIGPAGLSLGVRHHLVSDKNGARVFPETGGESAPHQVFKLISPSSIPDPLSLGKWISVSGAAFSTAAGANTTVPIAILAGLFNVRLGYWWDSGTIYKDALFERLLPVQALLLQELLARTKGTAGRRWNLSDGGHFENMGGYELIRRRLPIIVIVDAEADPNYTFEGLANLVRKARLDFGAEIIFLTEPQIRGTESVAGRPKKAAVPASAQQYFGNLDALRRGRWSNDAVPFPPPASKKQFAIEVDRSRTSRAHAAIARIQYSGDDAGWLVYVKATLMGDEPEDVCHYHRSFPDFPQQTTIDQFFDESQWESYRRLGAHISHRVFTPALFEYLIANPAGTSVAIEVSDSQNPA